jgi:hypothetical protein
MSLYRDAPSTPGEKDGERDFRGGPLTREIQRQGRVFVRQSTNYANGRAKAVALQYY